jgi:mono/diheme cytochrome c family protein
MLTTVQSGAQGSTQEFEKSSSVTMSPIQSHRQTLCHALFNFLKRKGFAASVFAILASYCVTFTLQVSTFAQEPAATPAPAESAPILDPVPDFSEGAAIYKAKCASCHGAEGEGVPDKYASALIGDRPVIDLAEIIDQTMPEEDPSLCTGEDARKVAEYIHHTFYSEIAQARRRPARVDIARMTVTQYRNSVIDLVNSFTWTSRIGEGRGLLVTYFNSRGFNPRNRADEGIDDEINFHWGTRGPLPEQLIYPEFSVRWEGSLIAPETGSYDFIIRTNNGTRLWLNDRQTALVDAWVRSGNDQEYRSSIYLVAGRAYPLRLEFFKAKEDKTTSIELAWKLPSGEESIVSARYLSPVRSNELIIPSTPFPPDDRSIGYERGTTISKAWEQATTMGAIEVADSIVKRLPELAGFNRDAPLDQQREKVKNFASTFVKRALRRSLSEQEQKQWIERHFENDAPVDNAIKRIVILTLKSPSFLYVDRTRDATDPYQIASRLSFGIWDSVPDETLLQKAASGEIKNPAVQREQIERMLRDQRSKTKLRAFIHHWLGTRHAIGLSKSKELYPDFDPQTLADLHTSLDLFIDDVLENPNPDFRLFLKVDYLYLNERLAKLYGYDLNGAPIAGTNSSVEASFYKVKMDPQQRTGVLAHPLVLAMYSYHNASSPIHRGVFMTRHVLGRRLKAPPAAVSPFSEDLHPSLTTRERTVLQTQAATCQSCHDMINNLGFSLESFDAIGRFRAEERGKAIDDRGEYLQENGELVSFDGVKPLGDFLLNSTEVQDAFIEQLFHHMIKQPVRAYGNETPDELRRRFAENQFDIRRLMIDIAEIACRGPHESVAPTSSTAQTN